MFLRRALRYRWAQALVLAGVSLLIGTCAVFAPWYSRAVEQTVMTETLTGQRLTAAWQIAGQPRGRTQGPGTDRPETLDQLVPADVRPLFSPPVHGIYSDIGWRSDVFDEGVPGRLTWRDGYCEQLVLVEGRCPKAANEVIAGTTDTGTWQFKVGTVLTGTPVDGTGQERRKLTVVGLYKPKEARGTYWFGAYPTGHSRIPGGKDPGSSDFLFTDRTTFDGDFWAPRMTADTVPVPGVAALDDLPRLQDASRTVNGNAVQQGIYAQTVTGLVSLVDQIQSERKQATTIIPLIMVQVALFGVVVLALALGAVVDQRRPEIALARLRGSSARRTARTLSTELGLPVLIGTLAGVLSGFGLLMIVRATWLRHGAPIELPWTVPVALAVAVVVALVVVLLQVRTVVRQPISGLLRRVVPRRRGRAIGVLDLSIIVFAVAGLAASLTGDGRGPLPVLTPALLALAVGLTFAHLLLPIAGLISRQAARRGRLGLALGALQVSRRPAVTRIVAAVAVAGGLLSFAGQAASVGDHNRDTRAGYETGAQAVLRMNALYLSEFTRAVDQIDPDRRWMTPVVTSRPPAPDSLKTVMIEPSSFPRIAFRGDQLTDAEGWKALTAPTGLKPIEFRSSQLTVIAATGPMKPLAVKTSTGQQTAAQPPKSVVLRANVVSLRNGGRYLVTFPAMPLVPGKPVQLRAPVDCLGGCQLLRLGIGREPLDQAGAQGDVIISKISSDDRPSITIGSADDWQSVRQPGSDQGSITAKAGGLLTIAVKSLGNDQFLQYATVPPVVPALVTPEFRFDDATTSPAIDGTPLSLTKIDRLRGPVNRYPDRTAVVDLETVRRLAGTVDEWATDYELWLNADGLANVDTITEKLTQAGFAAELVDRRDDRIASYGRSASALALQLTPVVGIASWALALVVLLLTVVTSWRSRAQDYASLRITGVPTNTTGRAARWEQTGPVALAVLLGSVCGVVGAQMALPLIPLFADTGGPIPLELATNWLVALVLWVVGTAVLAAATLLLGTGVNRRAAYSRIREELT